MNDRIRSCIKTGNNLIETLKHVDDTPCIIYSKDTIKNIINLIRKDTQDILGFHLFYSVKANSCPNILEFIKSLIDGVEVASENEYKLVRKIGYKNIIVTFPGPKANFIENLYSDNNIFDFNSLSSMQSLSELLIGKEIGLRMRLPKERNISRFGVLCNNEKLHKFILDNSITVRRLHYHFDNHTLSNITNIIAHINELQNETKWFKNINCISFGGGLNNLYCSDVQNLKMFWDKISIFSKKINLKQKVDIIFEPGTLLMLYSGYLITTVTEVLIENEIQQLVVDASAFNLTSWFRPNLIFPKQASDSIKTEIYGCTCFENDFFTKTAVLPKLKVGDRLLFYPVGAYVSSVARKLHMLPVPNEFLI